MQATIQTTLRLAAVLPVTLLLIGGLRVLQTAVLVVSLPILVVGVLMSYCLVKQLSEDHRLSGEK